MKHKALSIRQPWAWLIAHGHKDVENRTWSTQYRGPLLIHASSNVPISEYQRCYYLAQDKGITIPARRQLTRGGIVGIADLVSCVTQHNSPWFFGPYGFVLTGARPLPFFECRGQLGLFEVDIPAEVLYGAS